MSLLRFLAKPDVTKKIATLRPKMSRKIGVPARVMPRSTRYAVIGQAFDYLLRFELQRLAPHALIREWVAEQAPDVLWHVPQEEAENARRVVSDAKNAVTHYVGTTPSGKVQRELAAHAVRLAKLDSLVRALQYDSTFQEAAPDDVEELVEMLAIVPVEKLLHPTSMLLNPTFGNSSFLVGGADADLIAGDLLLDVKVIKADSMEACHLDQLLGYLLLARKQRLSDSTFPEINRLGLYFARHGHFLSFDACAWTTHPEFPELETWFFERAKECA